MTTEKERKASLDAYEQQREAQAQWEMVQVQLPDGYRIVGSVDRPCSDGNVMTPGDTYDLGQNAEGQFRLFRRSKDPWTLNSHAKGEILSDVDLAGFGLTRSQSCEEAEQAEQEGNFSSLCKSHLIEVH